MIRATMRTRYMQNVAKGLQPLPDNSWVRAYVSSAPSIMLAISHRVLLAALAYLQ